MNLEAEQIHLISQVLSIRDAEVLLRVRQFLDNLTELTEQDQAVPSPVQWTEQEFLAKVDASEAAFERGEVLTHEEVLARFRPRP